MSDLPRRCFAPAPAVDPAVGDAPASPPAEDPPRLAACALLVEPARADGEFSEVERAHIADRHDVRMRPPALRPAVAFAILALACAAGVARAAEPLPAAAVERFADLALACVHQEYPNKLAHALASDADVLPPRTLTPAFYGCYDWHSSVHGHWLLARLARSYPDAAFTPRARAALAASLTPERMASEVRYLEGPGRISFERPYGLAWLLQLHAELAEWDAPQAREWAAAVAPLARLCAQRLTSWLPKLTEPIRIGEHNQTAFALGLALDWARTVGDSASAAAFTRAIERFYLGDRRCPFDYEPSGEDFLSPCLAEADVGAVSCRGRSSHAGSKGSCRKCRATAGATGSSPAS